jgi:hypothetical protein
MSRRYALDLFSASQCPLAILQAKAKEQIAENRSCGLVLKALQQSALR